jgi:hypothetical protein
MRIERYNSTSAAEHVLAFIGLYAEVYGVPPYAEDPFFSVDRYAGRLAGAMAMPGFEIVTATVDGLLVGIGHGVTLPRECGVVAEHPGFRSRLISLKRLNPAISSGCASCRCARRTATKVSAGNCTTTCVPNGANLHHHDRHH